MHIEQAREIAQRIRARAQMSPGGVVATDGDGTLWSGDVGDDLYEAILAQGAVRPRAHEAMVRAALALGLDAGGDATTLGRRLWADFHAGRFPEEPFYELMAWCFAGFTPDEVGAFGREVVRATKLHSRLHDEVARVLDDVRAAGIDVFLVSASPRPVVEAAAEIAGVPLASVVAATPLYDDAGMMPEVDRPIPYGPGKVARLRARIGARPLYAAFGDNAFDVTMLASADVPVAVRPKDKLRARAAEVPGIVELAR